MVEVQHKPPARELDWQALLEIALTMPGDVGNTYSRFYPYSFGNVVLLYSQGIEPQPVATYKRWQQIGRQVLKGSKAAEIIRPITIKLKDQLDERGNPKTLTKFKPVPCIFPLSATEGPELPALETPGWSLADAMHNLKIEEQPWKLFEGNTQGYSHGRTLSINPVAVSPIKTCAHEMGHIELGHTTPDRFAEYSKHPGLFEFQAESTAYLVCNEIGELSDAQASQSRGYIQGWLRGETPPDKSIREVFKATTSILNAGRLAIEGEAAS